MLGRSRSDNRDFRRGTPTVEAGEGGQNWTSAISPAGCAFSGGMAASSEVKTGFEERCCDARRLIDMASARKGEGDRLVGPAGMSSLSSVANLSSLDEAEPDRCIRDGARRDKELASDVNDDDFERVEEDGSSSTGISYV